MAQVRQPSNWIGLKDRQKPVEKQKHLRDRAWLAFLRSRPCEVPGCTSLAGNDAAHKGHSEWGMKGGDDEAGTLCRKHHNEFDTWGKGKGDWWLRFVELPKNRARYREWVMPASVSEKGSE